MATLTLRDDAIKVWGGERFADDDEVAMDDVDAFRCPMHRTNKAESPFVWVLVWALAGWLVESLVQRNRAERA